MKYLRLVALFGIIFSYSSVSSAQDWDVTFVLSPSGNPNHSVFMSDLNQSGQLSGTSDEEPGPGLLPISTPIFLSSGQSSYLPYYGSIQRETKALGINDSGVVVGYSADGSDPTRFAVKWENQAISSLGSYNGYLTTKAYDINNAGRVIGESYDDSRNPSTVGWIYENGVFTALPVPQGYNYCIPRALNDAGVVIGACHIDYFPLAGFVWQQNLSVSELPRYDDRFSQYNIPYDINEHGVIVGQVIVPGIKNTDNEYPGYWANYSTRPELIRTPTRNLIGTKLNIDTTGGIATSINNLGAITGITGFSQPGGGYGTAAFWFNKNSDPAYLTSLLYEKYKKEVSPGNFNTKVNDCGQILLSDKTYGNPVGCICGVNTVDANNNNILDCMEPTVGTKPFAPIIGVKGSRVYVTFTTPPPGLGFKTVVQAFNGKNKRIGKKTTSGSQVEFKKLFGRTRKGQRLTVKANIYWTNGTITTQTSKRITKKFRVK